MPRKMLRKVRQYPKAPTHYVEKASTRRRHTEGPNLFRHPQPPHISMEVIHYLSLTVYRCQVVGVGRLVV